MIPSRSLLRLLAPLCLVASTQMTEVSAQVTGEEATSDSATIRAVRYHVGPSETRVWFETTGAVLYTHYSPDPHTLVIDLPAVDISALNERTVVGSREVESILATNLVGANGKKLSRIEVKLAAVVPYQISGSDQALNLVFDGGEIGQSAPSSSPESMVQAAPPPSPPPVPSAPAAENASRAASSAPQATGSEPGVPKVPKPKVSTRPASALSGVSHKMVGDVLSVVLEANGRLNYTSFELDAPKRLVFDFTGVVNSVARAAHSIDQIGVSRVRVAQFSTNNPQITRVVFDLEDEVPYRAYERDGSVEVSFSRSPEAFASPALASIDDEEPESNDSAIEQEPKPDTITIQGKTESGGTYFLSQEASPSSPEDSSLEPVKLTAQNLSMGNPMPLLPSPPPAQEPVPQPSALPGSQTFIAPGGQQPGERVYTGELISLDFKDGDIQDIFRLFADISGLNIVVQPGVTGRITLKLVEVPWDQALELILKTNKLGYVVEGNVIRIAPLSELATEEAERRRLAEEQALAGNLFTQTRVLSYAKAAEIEPLLQRNLSARGDIVIDTRTNTVIFTDLADQMAAINQLIDTLDTPIPGVEIEARIVV
ncbi:MAG TPA: AMIN domain-containing protein, partial [Vicinamibacteria bacterium]|nr:AMIN domain-containing protein [Vicinamibacteria bacterium]